MKKTIIILPVMILLLTSCGSSYSLISPSHDYIETMSESNILIQNQSSYHSTKEVTLTAVGDIMVHINQLDRAYDSQTDTFDFQHAFRHLKPYLEASDYTVGNLETTLAGKDNGRKPKDRRRVGGYSGYPYFNAPEVLARNLKDAGFDLLNTANNHSLDSWPEGVKHTLDVLDDADLLHVGTYRTENESEEIRKVIIKDISFSFIGYTYGTNTIPLPEDELFIVNSFDMNREGNINEVYYEQMLLDVKEVSNTDTDFVVVFIHFGNEYKNYPNVHQRKMVDDLFEAGADVIFGSHPHVLQPMEIRELRDENGKEKLGVVIYSLGNFLSSQRHRNTDIGTLFTVHFEKIDNHKPVIKGVSLVPTLCYRNPEELSILPVYQAYGNLKENPLELSLHEREQLVYSYQNTIDHLLTYIGDEHELTYQDYTYYLSLEE